MARTSKEQSMETRKNILECAKRLFSKRGYERTSISDIAKYSGVTRGAVYWHFESKEELLLGLVEYVDDNNECASYFYAAMDQNNPAPLDNLQKCVLTMFNEDSREFFSSSFVNMIIGITHGFAGNDEARDKLVELDNLRMKQLSNILRNCVSKKQLPSNLDINAATEHLALFMSGFFFQSRMNKTDSLKKYFEKMVDIEIDAIKQLTVG